MYFLRPGVSVIDPMGQMFVVEEMTPLLVTLMSPRGVRYYAKPEAVRAWRLATSAPKCTCDIKALFDLGCQCEYARWKKGP